MKPLLFQQLGLALLIMGGTASGQIVTGADLVRIEVRMQSDEQRKELPQTTADTVTQIKTLNIVLSGKAKSPEARTGKWTAYGRSLKGNDLKVLESGEFRVDFANGSQKIESKKVRTTYTPEHATVSTVPNNRNRGAGANGNNSNNNRTTTKKVAAAGTKFVGFGVVVKDGERIVGEYFDPSGLKAEAGK